MTSPFKDHLKAEVDKLCKQLISLGEHVDTITQQFHDSEAQVFQLGKELTRLKDLNETLTKENERLNSNHK